MDNGVPRGGRVVLQQPDRLVEASTAGSALPTELVSIQWLRGIAAIMVAMVHLRAPFGRMGYEGAWPLFLEGGVDIFFVISGFIMWKTTMERPIAPGPFLLKRLVRIVPLYWVMTALFVAIMLVFPGVVNNGAFELSHVIKSFLFVPSQHPVLAPAMYPVIMAGWTLNCEMFVYLLFALGLFLEPQRRLWLILGALAGLAILGFVLPTAMTLSSFYTRDVFLEFGFGILLAKFHAQRVWPIWLCTLLLAGGAALLVFAYAPGQALHLPRAVIGGAPAFFIVAGVVSLERRKRLPDLASLRLLGDASYSLYLVHPLVLSGLGLVWLHSGSGGGMFGLLAYGVLATLITCLAGVLCHALLEKPLIRFFGDIVKRGKAALPATDRAAEAPPASPTRIA
jgi:peptidoglycan/LPS O-acetylase OafA/YrhL